MRGLLLENAPEVKCTLAEDPKHHFFDTSWLIRNLNGGGDAEVLVMGGSPPKGADGSVEAVVADTPG